MKDVVGEAWSKLGYPDTHPELVFEKDDLKKHPTFAKLAAVFR